MTEERDLVQLDRDRAVKRMEEGLVDKAECEERLLELRKELSEARRDAMEVQGQLQLMKVAQMSGVRNNSGNSLFGEVKGRLVIVVEPRPGTFFSQRYTVVCPQPFIKLHIL